VINKLRREHDYLGSAALAAMLKRIGPCTGFAGEILIPRVRQTRCVSITRLGNTSCSARRPTESVMTRGHCEAQTAGGRTIPPIAQLRG
jgi:hypothetical protein